MTEPFDTKPTSAIRAKIAAALEEHDPKIRHPFTRRVCSILALTQDEDCDAYRRLLKILDAYRMLHAMHGLDIGEFEKVVLSGKHQN
jgi:hypothetical protein